MNFLREIFSIFHTASHLLWNYITGNKIQMTTHSIGNFYMGKFGNGQCGIFSSIEYVKFIHRLITAFKQPFLYYEENFIMLFGYKKLLIMDYLIQNCSNTSSTNQKPIWKWRPSIQLFFAAHFLPSLDLEQWSSI